MIIPSEEQQRNFEQICESIKNLDIRQQQSSVNNIQQQQHYPTIEPISNLPSINELLDYQLLIKRIKELEINSHLQSQEIEYLRKENSELNEKLSLLVQVEVNIQLESKVNQLKQEFNHYKEELDEKYSKQNNSDMKVMNDFFGLDNQEDKMVFDDNTFESNFHQNTNFHPYSTNNDNIPPPIYLQPPINLQPQIDLQRDAFNVNDNNNSNFDNIHRELRNIANGFSDDRDSLTEKMNSLRNMIYHNQ